LVVTDNIGINLDDTSGTLSDAEIETIDVNVASIGANAVSCAAREDCFTVATHATTSTTTTVVESGASGFAATSSLAYVGMRIECPTTNPGITLRIIAFNGTDTVTVAGAFAADPDSDTCNVYKANTIR